MPDGDCSPPSSVSLLVQNQVDRLLCLACCTDDEPLVILQHLQPVLKIGRVVTEAAAGFQADVIHQRSGSNLRDKLFLAVVFRSEEGGLAQPVQPLGVSGAMGQFMEDRAVILCGADELLADGENHFIGGGSVEGPVSFFVGELHAFAAQVVVDDFLGGFQRSGSIREDGFRGVLGGDAFALVNVEHVVISEEGGFYTVSPYNLIYSDDNYYLLAYDPEHKDFRPYRIDRMANFGMTNLPREGEDALKDLNLENYQKYTFNMYGGDVKTVTLRVSNRMMGAIIDKFGKQEYAYPVDDRHFEVNLNIAVSPQFYGWVFGLKNYVTIVSPPEVVEEMKEHLMAVMKRYE